jgi:hypothetical protein
MPAKKKVCFLIVLLLLSTLTCSVGALPDTTVTFRGGGVTVDLTFPEEVHPNTTITHGVTITAANGAVTVENFTLVIKAPVNSSLQQIYRSPEPFSFELPENGSISMAPPPRFTLPQDADGKLYCFIFIQTNRTIDYVSYMLYTTQVREVTYSELLNAYNALVDDYGVLNNTCSQLLVDYVALNDTYNELLLSYATLNSTYYGLSDDYSDLNSTYKDRLGQYAILNDKYVELNYTYNNVNSARNSLLEDKRQLQSDYDLLNSTHYSLNETYNSLHTVYDELNQTYTDLLTDFNDLQGRITRSENELNSDKIVMFIFIVAVAALVAFIVYLKRKQQEPYLVIRKETVSVKPEEKKS